MRNRGRVMKSTRYGAEGGCRGKMGKEAGLETRKQQ